MQSAAAWGILPFPGRSAGRSYVVIGIGLHPRIGRRRTPGWSIASAGLTHACAPVVRNSLTGLWK